MTNEPLNTEKESFRDESLMLLRGMVCTKIASEYFHNLKAGVAKNTKHLFNTYTNKLDWILSDCADRIDNESKRVFEEEVRNSDVIGHEEILSDLIFLTPEERLLVSKVIKALRKGEKLDFVDETKNY